MMNIDFSQVERIKLQVQTVSVSSGATAAVQADTNVTLDPDYDECLGYSILDIKDTLDTEMMNYGLKSFSGQQIIDLSYSALHLVTSSTPADARFHPIRIPARGQQYKIQQETLETIGSDVSIQFVFFLVKWKR